MNTGLIAYYLFLQQCFMPIGFGNPRFRKIQVLLKYHTFTILQVVNASFT